MLAGVAIYIDPLLPPLFGMCFILNEIFPLAPLSLRYRTAGERKEADTKAASAATKCSLTVKSGRDVSESTFRSLSLPFHPS